MLLKRTLIGMLAKLEGALNEEEHSRKGGVLPNLRILGEQCLVGFIEVCSEVL